MDLNNREIALLVWTVVALLWILSKPDVRPAALGVCRAFAHPQILVPIIAFLGYVTGCLALGSKVGIWETDQMSDTVLWALVTGAILFGSFKLVYTQDDYFQRTLKRAVTGAAFVEVFIGLVVLPLLVELLLVPLATLLAMVAVVAESKEEFAPAKKLVDGLLALIGIALFVYVTSNLIIHFSDLDGSYTGRTFALPVWMTLVILPFFYALGLFAAYDSAFRMIGFYAEDSQDARRARRHLFRLGFRARRVGRFTGPWQKEIARSDEPRQVIDRFRAEATI